VPFLQQIIKVPAYLLASVPRKYTTIVPHELRANKMRFPIKSLIAIGAFMLAGCSNEDAATIVPVEQAPTVFAKVQALHASPDAPLVNVMVDGTVIAAGADYMDASAEGAGPPGTVSVSVDAIMPGGDVEIFAGMDFATSDDIVEKLLVVILCTSLWCLQAFVINTRSESPPVVLTKFVVSICVCVQAMVMTWKFVTSVTEQQI